LQHGNYSKRLKLTAIFLAHKILTVFINFSQRIDMVLPTADMGTAALVGTIIGGIGGFLMGGPAGATAGAGLGAACGARYSIYVRPEQIDRQIERVNATGGGLIQGIREGMSDRLHETWDLIDRKIELAADTYIAGSISAATLYIAAMGMSYYRIECNSIWDPPHCAGLQVVNFLALGSVGLFTVKLYQLSSGLLDKHIFAQKG
jgi:hypothetical protein